MAGGFFVYLLISPLVLLEMLQQVANKGMGPSWVTRCGSFVRALLVLARRFEICLVGFSGFKQGPLPHSFKRSLR